MDETQRGGAQKMMLAVSVLIGHIYLSLYSISMFTRLFSKHPPVKIE